MIQIAIRISHLALSLSLPKGLDMNNAYMLTYQSCKQVSEAHISINETRAHSSVRGKADQAGAATLDRGAGRPEVKISQAWWEHVQ